MEFSIRQAAGKSREDQAEAPRVYLSTEAFTTLKLSIGKPIILSRVEVETSVVNGDHEVAQKESLPRLGIAWNSQQPIKIGVAQMVTSFRELCGFKLTDKLNIAPAGDLRVATVIKLEVCDGKDEGISQEDQTFVEWNLKKKLQQIKIVFVGMTVELVLPRKTFRIVSLQDDAGRASLMGVGPISVTSISEDVVPSKPSTFQIDGIAGIDKALARLNGFLAEFNKPRAPSQKRRKGFVIHGGPGTGKSHLLDEIERRSSLPVFRITPDEARPAQLKSVFAKAILREPSVVLIDELEDCIAETSSFARSLAAELKNLTGGNAFSAKVAVIATYASAVDFPARLRTSGVFDMYTTLPVPDASTRHQILEAINRDGPGIEYGAIKIIAEKSHAYTAGDLHQLSHEMWSNMEAEHRDVVSLQDMEKAMLVVRPSAMHDITLQPPKVLWDDIGGQELIKKALKSAVEDPMKLPALMHKFGLVPTKGLLLYGPPGCSKTLSAQAMATEAGFNFFAVKGAELLNMYVGESERAIRNIFSRAQAASPSIIFFDEIDAIAGKRDGRNSGVNVLTTLLNEMDGIETLEGVTVLAATNRPEALDSAILRPGRFDYLLYVAPPDQAGREAILRVRQRKGMACVADVDVAEVARLTDGYTGAEIVSICQKAGRAAFDRALRAGVAAGEVDDSRHGVRMDDFVEATKQVRKQVTAAMVKNYEDWATGVKGGL